MSSDRTDFELYKVATMQGIAWQTDKHTDKQTITLAGRFHFTSAAGYITVSPPPLHCRRNIRLFVRERKVGRTALRCFVLIPNPCYHILCIIDPSSSTEPAIVLGSWICCFLLHSFGYQSCSQDSPPVLPTPPRELAWALIQSDSAHQSIACPISPRASFL
jgi:hypothetical protein